jgi:AAA domain
MALTEDGKRYRDRRRGAEESASDNGQRPDDPPALVLTRMSEVTPRPVAWLWRSYLPLGKLVILDGDPSVGKSTLAVDFAAVVWGVDVLQSTAFARGEGVLLDTQLMGKVCVRESLTLRKGFAGDDVTSNIVRWVAEERLNLAVERPAAICWIKSLPTKSAKK